MSGGVGPELPPDRWHVKTGVDIFYAFVYIKPVRGIAATLFAPPITALRHARGKFHAQRTRHFHNGFKAWLGLW